MLIVQTQDLSMGKYPENVGWSQRNHQLIDLPVCKMLLPLHLLLQIPTP